MKAVSIILFSLFFTLVILLLSYQLVLGFIPLTAQQQNTLDYLQGKEELSLPYTEQEQLHLLDVKEVMNKTDYLFYGSLLMVILLLGYYGKQRQLAAKLLRTGSITMISSATIILLMIVFSFNSSFALFHRLFFPQGNWQFPANSLLITVFPLEFFISISASIFILSLVLAGIAYLAGKRI